MSFGRSIQKLPGFRYANMPRRFLIAFRHLAPKLSELVKWVFTSKEDTNFTYQLSERNIRELASTIATIAETTPDDVMRLIREPLEDAALCQHVIACSERPEVRARADRKCEFGRRLGWYAFVRLLKPAVVVETGIDKGLGAVLLCSALLRNRAEGYPGQYLGTDINPHAGWMLTAPYNDAGKILYGDSIESLKGISQPIDLFINDSDHSDAYEYREYLTISSKLSDAAVILGDNSHMSDSLLRFSTETNRQFIFFKEQPAHHWYSGAGIGISFRSSTLKAHLAALNSHHAAEIESS